MCVVRQNICMSNYALAMYRFKLKVYRPVFIPESYTSKGPWRAEGVQAAGVAVIELLLGSASVFTPSLCGEP